MSGPTALSLLALALSVLAVALTIRAGRGRHGGADSPLPTDVAGLREEVERLRRSASGALSAPVVVRYDAFGDMGGRLSWSLALVDERGSGVVLTSIHGRSEARSYAKALQDWVCDQQLSPEEEKAVAAARAR